MRLGMPSRGSRIEGCDGGGSVVGTWAIGVACRDGSDDEGEMRKSTARMLV